MKAVFVTNEGVFGYNLAANSLKELALAEIGESRIEIIAKSINEAYSSAVSRMYLRIVSPSAMADLAVQGLKP